MEEHKNSTNDVACASEFSKMPSDCEQRFDDSSTANQYFSSSPLIYASVCGNYILRNATDQLKSPMPIFTILEVNLSMFRKNIMDLKEHEDVVVNEAGMLCLPVGMEFFVDGNLFQFPKQSSFIVFGYIQGNSGNECPSAILNNSEDNSFSVITVDKLKMRKSPNNLQEVLKERFSCLVQWLNEMISSNLNFSEFSLQLKKKLLDTKTQASTEPIRKSARSASKKAADLIHNQSFSPHSTPSKKAKLDFGDSEYCIDNNRSADNPNLAKQISYLKGAVGELRKDLKQANAKICLLEVQLKDAKQRIVILESNGAAELPLPSVSTNARGRKLGVNRKKGSQLTVKTERATEVQTKETQSSNNADALLSKLESFLSLAQGAPKAEHSHPPLPTPIFSGIQTPSMYPPIAPSLYTQPMQMHQLPGQAMQNHVLPCTALNHTQVPMYPFPNFQRFPPY